MKIKIVPCVPDIYICGRFIVIEVKRLNLKVMVARTFH